MIWAKNRAQRLLTKSRKRNSPEDEDMGVRQPKREIVDDDGTVMIEIDDDSTHFSSNCDRSNFTEKASKTSVSYEAYYNFHRRNFQNDRFAQGSSKFHRRRSFRARLPPNFKGEASKMIVSCEASSKFQRRSFQNERFVKMSMSVKLPSNFTEEAFKMIVCARVPPNFTEEASKMIVSRVASSKFQRRSFQNDRFVRGFLQISKKKLPKRAFHTRLITIFTKETSKMIVSLKGRPNFTEEDRFARGCLRISKEKLPK